MCTPLAVRFQRMLRLCSVVSICVLLCGACGQPDPPLAQRELGDLLYVPGDPLPRGFIAGEVHHGVWPPLKRVIGPVPATASYQIFLYQGRFAGIVQVLLYAKPRDMTDAERAMTQGGWQQTIADVMLREQGAFYVYRSFSGSVCYATIKTVFLEPVDQTATLDQYDDVLKQRMTPHVCQGDDADTAIGDAGSVLTRWLTR